MKGTKGNLFLDHISNPEFATVHMSIDLAVVKGEEITFLDAVELVLAHSRQIVWDKDKSNKVAERQQSRFWSNNLQNNDIEQKRHGKYNVPMIPKWLFTAIPFNVFLQHLCMDDYC